MKRRIKSDSEQKDVFRRPKMPRNAKANTSYSESEEWNSDRPGSSSSGSNLSRLSSGTSERSYPKYKVLFSEGIAEGWLGVRGIQSTELIDGKPQQPIIVKCLQQGKYMPRKIPNHVANETSYWSQVKEMLKDVFHRPGNPVKGDRKRAWIMETVTPHLTEWKDLRRQHGEVLAANIHHAVAIRFGFLNALGNIVGRIALDSVLHLCRETLLADFEDIYADIGLRNCGGGTHGYAGSCTIGRFTGDWTVSDEEAMEYLATCKEPKEGYKGFETKVADGQTFAITDAQVSSGNDLFHLTAKVKSVRTGRNLTANNPAILQTWLQALVGLSKSDTTYAVLLTPLSGHIMELQVVQPHRRQGYRYLLTKDRTWNFLQVTDEGDELFSVSELTEFMEGIIDIMYRGGSRQ